MNIIKFWYSLYRARVGKMDDQEISRLVETLNEAECNDPDYGDRKYCRSILATYCRYNVPSSAQLKEIFGGVSVYCFLENVGKRKQPLTDEEQQAILKLPEYCMEALTMPLSAPYEIKLLESGRNEALISYLEKPFRLSLAAERKLISHANVNHDFIWLAVHYVNAHLGDVFVKHDAQQLLFEAKNCEAIQEALIEHSTMQQPLLFDSSIEQLITKSSKRQLLLLFLSRSYVANQQLQERLKLRTSDRQLQALVQISMKRRWLLFDEFHNSDWRFLTAGEKEIIATTKAEEREQFVRMQVVPKMQKGETSPAMAAWVACRYPHLAQLAAMSTDLFVQRIKNCRMFFDMAHPFDNFY